MVKKIVAVTALGLCLSAVGCSAGSTNTSENVSTAAVSNSAEDVRTEAVSNTAENDSSSAAISEAETAQEPFTLPEDAVTYSLHETLELDGVTYTFDEIRDQDGYDEIPAGEGMQYMGLKFTIENQSEDEYSFNFLTDLTVYCDGVTISPMDAGYLGDSKEDREAADWLVSLDDLKAGEKDSGWINVNVPADYEQLIIVFRRHMIEFKVESEEGYFVYYHE